MSFEEDKNETKDMKWFLDKQKVREAIEELGLECTQGYYYDGISATIPSHSRECKKCLFEKRLGL